MAEPSIANLSWIFLLVAGSVMVVIVGIIWGVTKHRRKWSIGYKFQIKLGVVGIIGLLTIVGGIIWLVLWVLGYINL